MEGKSGTLTPQLTKCPGCGEEFCSYNELIDHVVVAHNITCQVCGEKLNSKRDLLAHNREKHGIGGDAIG
jgi:transcription elongation factor Elf1